MTTRSFLAAGVALELSLIAAAALLGICFQGSAFPFILSGDLRAVLIGIGATLPAAAFAVFATSEAGLRFGPLKAIHDLLKESLGGPLAGLSFPGILLLSAAAGVGEEVLFRGVLAPWLGVAVANIIFGLCHAANRPLWLFATLMGFYLSAVHRAAGNLMAPILLHSLYDAAALWLYQRRFRAGVDGGGPAMPGRPAR